MALGSELLRIRSFFFVLSLKGCMKDFGKGGDIKLLTFIVQEL